MDSLQEQSSPVADDEKASPPEQPSTENTSGVVSSLRFLISNAAAGSVIGKGGATIGEFQNQSGARIQLSRNHEYFPGTTDRIILIMGTVKEILAALQLVLPNITTEIDEEYNGGHKSNLVRLILPNNVCGAIIGKGGATIKAFVEDTGANIKLSSQEQAMTGLTVRIVTIAGTIAQQLKAVESIVAKLSEDFTYSQFANTPIFNKTMISLGSTRPTRNLPAVHIGYSPLQYAPAGPPNPNWKCYMPIAAPPAPRSPLQITLPVVEAGPVTTSLTVAVPDHRIGALVGRGGKTIMEIQQVTGVKIKISDRGDFVTGTKDRKVTLAGTADGVRIAHHLLTQKVQQSIASDYER